MSGVTFNGVKKMYGDVLAVENVDLEVADGEFVSVLGPSGSGKSTVLRMVAGLESISEGEISIGDRVINDVHPRDRGIAMVFQNYALYPHMTVRENMSYGLRLTTDLSKDEIRSRVTEAAEMLEIGDHLEKKPANLSGGQQQRVATGRAIVREPEVFLMDEPLSNLDAKLKVHMRTELQRIQEELDTTTIYVTHDQEEAMTLADRIVVLNDGKLQQVGTPKDVYYRPTNLFVADFIGSPSMNFFDVTLETDPSGGRLVHKGFTYEVSQGFVDAVREHRDGRGRGGRRFGQLHLSRHRRRGVPAADDLRARARDRIDARGHVRRGRHQPVRREHRGGGHPRPPDPWRPGDGGRAGDSRRAVGGTARVRHADRTGAGLPSVTPTLLRRTGRFLGPSPDCRV